MKCCFYIHQLNETGENVTKQIDFSGHVTFKHHTSGIKHSSFVWEIRTTIPLQLFFPASKFFLCVIWACEGCLCFQMFTWNFWTDGNQVRIIVQCFNLLCWKSVNPKCVLYTYKSDVLHTCSKPNTFRKYSKAKHMFFWKINIPGKKKSISKDFCPAAHSQSRCLARVCKKQSSIFCSPFLLLQHSPDVTRNLNWECKIHVDDTCDCYGAMGLVSFTLWVDIYLFLVTHQK